MALSISDAYKPKSQTARRGRRATVDAPCGLTARSNMKPEMKRRLSLQTRVEFSHTSEVCVFERSPSHHWYTGEDHKRMKRDRVIDVVAFRDQARRNSQGPSMPTSSSSSGGRSASSSAPSSPASAGSSCPVGLEQLLSSKAMLEAHSNRKIVIKSVLFEQNRQRTFGFQDPDQIAFISVKLTTQAFEGAQKRGKFQEMAKFME